jgi:hypothetical protein
VSVGWMHMRFGCGRQWRGERMKNSTIVQSDEALLGGGSEEEQGNAVVVSVDMVVCGEKCVRGRVEERRR